MNNFTKANKGINEWDWLLTMMIDKIRAKFLLENATFMHTILTLTIFLKIANINSFNYLVIQI
jgi:hypothetical protein